MTDPTPQVGDVVGGGCEYHDEAVITEVHADHIIATRRINDGSLEAVALTLDEMRGIAFKRNGREGVYA